MSTENYTKISMQDEYLMLYDDKIAISWLHDDDDNEPDFKTFPKRYKLGFISSISFATIFLIVILYGTMKSHTPFYSNIGLYFLVYPLFDCVYNHLFISDATEIKRDEIKKIHVGKMKMSIILKNKIIKRKRVITFPLDPHYDEIARQLLKENNLID